MNIHILKSQSIVCMRDPTHGFKKHLGVKLIYNLKVTSKYGGLVSTQVALV